LREIIDILNNNRKSSANINTANLEKKFELRMYDNNLKVEPYEVSYKFELLTYSSKDNDKTKNMFVVF